MVGPSRVVMDERLLFLGTTQGLLAWVGLRSQGHTRCFKRFVWQEDCHCQVAFGFWSMAATARNISAMQGPVPWSEVLEDRLQPLAPIKECSPRGACTTDAMRNPEEQKLEHRKELFEEVFCKENGGRTGFRFSGWILKNCMQMGLWVMVWVFRPVIIRVPTSCQTQVTSKFT